MRSVFRDDFPTHWWRSSRWWREAITDIGVRCLIVVAAVLLTRSLTGVIAHRNNPVKLARTDAHVDAYLAGCLASGMAVWFSGWTVGDDHWGSHVVLAGLLMTYSLANLIACLGVLAVLCRSRLLSRATWEQIDFVDRHSPGNGRPPETIEEYQALQRRSSL